DESGGTAQIAFFNGPDEVESSPIFQNIVSRLTASTFEFVAPVVPAVRTSDSNRLFVASFSPATGSGASNALWPGHLRSFDLAVDGSIPDPMVQNWDSATRFALASSSGRKIYTSVGGVRKDFVLNASSGVTADNLGATNDTEAAAIIDKVRSLGLGDIFHSTPVLVGSPSRYYPDVSGFEARQTFTENFSKRKRIVVFGANDGMLHGVNAGTWDASATPPRYNAGTGDEEWAFIPSFLLGKVKNFYRSPLTHNYYVDSPPAVADIWIDSTPGDRLDPHLASEWHTYLIGGAGKGGEGYFALDITDPTSLSYPQVKWELTKGTGSGQSPYLGQTWSTPAIGKIRKTVIISTLEYGYDQWVAIVGAGKAATSGSSTLAAVAKFKTSTGPATVSVANTGNAPYSGQITLSWIEIKGSKTKKNEAICSYTSKTVTTFENVYHQSGDRIDFPATSTIVSWGAPGEGRAILVLDAATGGILQTLTHASMGEVVAPPALVVDKYGYIERAYVGDLAGNVWRATIDNTASFGLGGSPFFIITGDNYSRKIYTKISLAKGVGSYPLWWVFFGTGDRENPMDFLGGAIFGVYDKDVFSKKGMTTTTKTESALVDASTYLANIGNSSASFPALGTKEGWFGPLPVDSEKMLSNPSIFNNNLFFTTFEPQAGDCSIGGTARIYGFGIAPGYNAGNYGLYLSSSSSTPDSRVLQLSNVGIPSSPVISVGPGGVATMYLGTTGSSVKGLKIPSATPTKSLRYWKELW
ncbi:MAG TPA: PilC/PilY family type IV pilus protein, partial [Candidatus Deferrimicrobiaceae bacterium]|nr:PilC/PilY family type IV pilus protein [Candidatus Deferrimicrobiaceae bacterium]